MAERRFSLAALALAALSAIASPALAEEPAAGLLGPKPVATTPKPAMARGDLQEATLAPVRDTRPKIAIVIDDLGLDWERFQAANRLPVPVSLAFLPYGKDAQAMLDSIDQRHAALLHLPMEPRRRRYHAGPDMVKRGTAEDIRSTLGLNLNKLRGYRGVNNHTGSLITEDPVAMRHVLTELQRRGLYFLDSKTTQRSVSASISTRMVLPVLEGSLFLDGDFGAGGEAHVQRQLGMLLTMAEKKGSAIGIGHPYPSTLRTLQEWTAQKQASVRFLTADQLADDQRAEKAKAGI
ncbi:MAG: divergent polysaccharide deacetylase family protein [Pseudomonadota bacterium]